MTRRIKMLTGQEIELDGDLMAVIESLYQEVVVKQELKHTYMDMKREIDNIIEQMDDNEARSYLCESLFLNVVSYENQMLDALLKSLREGNDIED